MSNPVRNAFFILTIKTLLVSTSVAQKSGSTYVPPDDVGRFRDRGAPSRVGGVRGRNSPLPVAGGNRQTRAAWTVSVDNPLKDVADLYSDYDKLKSDAAPVIVILDTQHPFIVNAQREMNTGVVAWINELKRTVGKLSGLPTRLVHYTQVRRSDLEKSNIKALFITARLKEIDRKYDRTLYEIIRTTKVPTLGICGGQSHITNAFGGRMALMPRLRDGESDPFPPYEPGTSKEWGFGPIEILASDPLFDGLGNEAVVRHYHAAHISSMPEGFANLASSEATEFQAIKHRERPLYGVMFHVELYDEQNDDGRTILNNFFRIAGIGNYDSASGRQLQTAQNEIPVRRQMRTPSDASPAPNEPARGLPRRLPSIDAVFNSLDQNNDDKLTEGEIPEARRAIFMRADMDGDGGVSRRELTRARSRLQNRGAPRRPAPDTGAN